MHMRSNVTYLEKCDGGGAQRCRSTVSRLNLALILQNVITCDFRRLRSSRKLQSRQRDCAVYESIYVVLKR